MPNLLSLLFFSHSQRRVALTAWKEPLRCSKIFGQIKGYLEKAEEGIMRKPQRTLEREDRWLVGTANSPMKPSREVTD